MPGMSGPKGGRRPNILFIITDQQRKDAMGAYGNPIIRTPNMDRLAREGMRFESVFIGAYPCSPSRASYLTGLYHHEHKVFTNNLVLDPRLPNVGNILKRAGYVTAWMGKWHLAGPYEPVYDEGGRPTGRRRVPPQKLTGPQKVGFDISIEGRDYVLYLRKLGLEEPVPGRKVRGWAGVIVDGHQALPEEHCGEAFLAKKAVEFLERMAGSRRPFFLGLSFHGPHRPMTPPRPWDKLYPPERMRLPENFRDDMRLKPRLTQQNFTWRMLRKGLDPSRLKRALVYEGEMWDLLDRGKFGEREFKELMAHYYGYVSYIDKCLGTVLRALDRLGLSEDTVVIFTTDHGELMGSHGCIFKGFMFYDELFNVPFIVRYPPLVKPGSVSRALISTIDVLPTILDLVGLPKPPRIRGRSFAHILKGGPDRHREAVFASIASENFRIVACMVRTRRFKYCLNFRPRQIDELYDLENDPGELRNLILEPNYRGVLERMQGLLFRWMKETRYPWAEEAMEAAGNPRPFVKAINFEFERPSEVLVWSAHRGISKLRWERGKMAGRIRCPGFIVCFLDEPVKAEDCPVILIRMGATAGRWAQFYWATEESPQFDERKSLLFPIVGDGKFREYRLDLGRHPLWRGRITAIRLNPVRRRGGKGELEAEFEIDCLKCLKGGG